MKTFPRQRGASMVELAIALPMFVMLIFIIAELAQMHEAKSVLDVAALSAARAGAVNGGSVDAMERAAAIALSPLYVSEASNKNITAAVGKALVDTNMVQKIGSVDVIGSFNGASGGLQRGIKIDVISPTSQMVKDFGVTRSDGSKTAKVIPNDNLMYRDTRIIGDVNIQDANLLKIKVTYLYKTKMPLTHYLFTPLMNANLTGVFFQGQSRLASGASVDNVTDWRIPMIAYATVRMQSDFNQKGADAGVPPGGGTTPGGGGTGTGGTGTGTGENEEDTDPEDLCTGSPPPSNP
ncbi:MAG: pilus assembly protein [Zoogloeaceae bacterium]|jgi:hypothetical protein|nr:pilus assembly protein [Zoogloeaceae bacterium]